MSRNPSVHRTTLATVLVLLAGGTGLAQYPVWTPPTGNLWPGETIPIFPDAKPVKPIIYAPGLTQEGFENRWHPVWELMARQAQAQARVETIPLPSERPAQVPEIGGTPRREVLPKRMAREAPDTCERVGLRKVYTDKWRWRCR